LESSTASSFLTILLNSIFHQYLGISEYTMGQVAEIGNVEPIVTWENTEAIFANMEDTSTWLHGRFTDLFAETAAIKDKIELSESSRRKLPSIESQDIPAQKDLLDIQVEITDTDPKSILGLCTYGGATVRPDVLELSGFDPSREEKFAINTHTTVELGDGTVLIKIPEEIKARIFFIKASLVDSDGATTADRTVMVSFKSNVSFK
jgi:hypothetical protein